MAESVGQVGHEELQVDVKPALEPARSGSMKKLQENVTKARRTSVQKVKANPKKAAGCGCCCIVIIILAIVIPAVVAGTVVAYLRYFRFSGSARTAAVGGAALGQGGRESLVPVRRRRPRRPPTLWRADS